MLKSSSLTSASTGVALQYNTEFAVATNVISGIITSSLVFIPIARNDNWSPAVAFDTPIENCDFVNFEKFLFVFL